MSITQHTAMHARNEIYKYTGPLVEEKYNKMFNPNICHVCKQPDKNLTMCNICCMISYCSEEHKALHHNSHHSICQAIAKVIREDSGWDTISRNVNDWMESQEEFVRIVRCIILRDLEPYEKEMFIWAKTCHICHRQNNLSTCQNCYSANFCDIHENQFTKQHNPHCKDLLLLLNIDITSIEDDNIYLDLLKFVEFPDNFPYHDMMAFVDEYITQNDASCHHFARKSTHSWKSAYYTCSDYVSSPLTLHRVLLITNLGYIAHNTDKFIIHIITASAIEVKFLPAWEIFLHLFKNIKELHIVMIKSKTFLRSNEYKNLCHQCSQKKFYIENVFVSYREYMNLESYKQPNVIAGFDAELSIKETWTESLAIIKSQNCPLVLTAKSRNKAQQIINKIRAVVRKRNVSDENAFSSCKPHKNYETGGVFYRNAYFVMFL